MSWVAVAGLVVSVVAGVSAQRQQAKVAEQTGEYNAKMNEYTAQDAQRRGEEEATAIRRRGAALKSSQRVSMAAKGLDLSYGSAADLQDQTDFFTQADVATARTNAAREAWTARAHGTLGLAQGKAAANNANLQATGTALSGASQVASKWYDMSSKPSGGR